MHQIQLNHKHYHVVHDPAPDEDGPLESGLALSKDEVDCMLVYGSFTPGTILRYCRQRMTVVNCPRTRANGKRQEMKWDQKHHANKNNPA